jgi:hypothetical protein
MSSVGRHAMAAHKLAHLSNGQHLLRGLSSRRDSQRDAGQGSSGDGLRGGSSGASDDWSGDHRELVRSLRHERQADASIARQNTFSRIHKLCLYLLVYCASIQR